MSNDKPAPAPLPEEVAGAMDILCGYINDKYPVKTPLAKVYRTILSHISDLARRLAELEHEACEASAAAHCYKGEYELLVRQFKDEQAVTASQARRLAEVEAQNEQASLQEQRDHVAFDDMQDRMEELQRERACLMSVGDVLLGSFECFETPEQIIGEAKALHDRAEARLAEIELLDAQLHETEARVRELEAEAVGLHEEISQRVKAAIHAESREDKAVRRADKAEARVRELEAKKDAAFWQGWALLAGFITGSHDEQSLVEEAAREHGVTLALLEASSCDEFELEPLRRKVFMSAALAATEVPNA